MWNFYLWNVCWGWNSLFPFSASSVRSRITSPQPRFNLGVCLWYQMNSELFQMFQMFAEALLNPLIVTYNSQMSNNGVLYICYGWSSVNLYSLIFFPSLGRLSGLNQTFLVLAGTTSWHTLCANLSGWLFLLQMAPQTDTHTQHKMSLPSFVDHFTKVGTKLGRNILLENVSRRNSTFPLDRCHTSVCPLSRRGGAPAVDVVPLPNCLESSEKHRVSLERCSLSKSQRDKSTWRRRRTDQTGEWRVSTPPHLLCQKIHYMHDEFSLEATSIHLLLFHGNIDHIDHVCVSWGTCCAGFLPAWNEVKGQTR